MYTMGRDGDKVKGSLHYALCSIDDYICSYQPLCVHTADGHEAVMVCQLVQQAPIPRARWNERGCCGDFESFRGEIGMKNIRKRELNNAVSESPKPLIEVRK